MDSNFEAMRAELMGNSIPPTLPIETGAAQTNTTQEPTPPTVLAQEPVPPAAAAPFVQATPTPPTVTENDWKKSYVEATGHNIQTVEEIKEALAYRQKYQELHAVHTDLEAKSKVSPYANDLIKTMNEMYASGAKESEVKAFMELQNVDTEVATPTDYVTKGERLIKMQMRNETPFLSEKQINALYDKKFADLDQEDDLAMAEFQSAAYEAKKYIDAKKVSAANPETLVQFRQTAEQKQVFENNVKTFVGSISAVEQPFEFKIGDNVDKFAFKATGEQVSHIQQVMAQSLVSKGIAPTQENMSKINGEYTQAFWQVCGQSAIDAAYRHAKADAQKQVYASVNGVAAPSPAPTATPQPDRMQNILKEYDRMNGFN